MNNIEEDIKILEYFILEYDEEIVSHRQVNQSIENLINAYKKNQNILDEINSKIKDLQNTCAEIQGTKHEGETVLYLMEIDLLQKLLKEK